MINELPINNSCLTVSNSTQVLQQQSIIGIPALPISNANVIAAYNLNNENLSPNTNFSPTSILQPLSGGPLSASSTMNSNVSTLTSSHATMYTLGAALNQIKTNETSINNVSTSQTKQLQIATPKSLPLPSCTTEIAPNYSSRINESNLDKNQNSENINITQSYATSVFQENNSRPLTPINQISSNKGNKRPTSYQNNTVKRHKMNQIISDKILAQQSDFKINNSINNWNVSNRSQNIGSNQTNSDVPINEITFFEKLKKSLRTQQVYENFLKCLSLFNREIVTRCELIALVEPFLSKFPNLFRWFKDYVENRHMNALPMSIMPSNSTFLNCADQIPLVEIDYLSCKQYGASYRDISSYPTPISSGQTDLCKQVLNASYVSFPSWSEDSTFISSKKNQYEEIIFRIDDERFELDNILETNNSTIKILESLQLKINKMTQDELNNYRLDNSLGGTSEVIQIKAIQRVYTDRAKDFIDGLKRNPSVAVPLVLKRLKAKDEEWREAKKNLEKQWREQMERNYLKSLDHCAGPFKQNDQKHLKTKSLINEIETIYYERQEAKGEQSTAFMTTSSVNTNIVNSDGNTNILQHNQPHFSFKYDDKSILDDVATLLIHHVKRQTAIQKEDKQKIKQIVYHFLSDLFFVNRGALSDDESHEPLLNSNSKLNHHSNVNTMSVELNVENTATNTKKLRSNNGSSTNTDTKNISMINSSSVTNDSEKLSKIDESELIKNVHDDEFKTNTNQEDMYRLFYVDEHWYLFLRYHQILCERLYKIYKHGQIIAEQEHLDLKSREQSVADALKLRNKPEVPVDEYYSTFLDVVKNLLDGNMDNIQYEDTLREMFGIHAYIAFTLDKVVHNCVRQLQYLVQDECSIAIKLIYTEEQRNGNSNNISVPPGSTLNIATLSNTNESLINENLNINKSSGCGGKVSNMCYSSTMNAELMYQKKAESLLNDQNCYKVLSYKNSCRLTVELIDTQSYEEDEKDVEIEKWSEYVEKYSSLEQQDSSKVLDDDLKEALLKRPVFLTRNAHILKQKYGNSTNHLRFFNNGNMKVKQSTSNIQDNNSAEKNYLKLNSLEDSSNTENQDKIKYNPNNTILMYRRNTFKNSRKVNIKNFNTFFK